MENDNFQLEDKKVKTVNEIIGRSLSKIGPYKQLDNKRQVVALIDDVSSPYENQFFE